MIYICILLYALIAPFSFTFEIQQVTDHKIPEQLRTSQKNAPASKTIVHSIHKRSTDELLITLNIDGIDRGYTLQSKKGLFAGLNTKIWLAKLKKNKRLKYTLQENIMEKVNITLFQDKKTQSIISHRVNKRGISEFSGIIDSDKVIRPYIRERRDVFSKSFQKRNDANGNNNHIVYKRAIANRNNVNSLDSSEFSIRINKSVVEEQLDIVYPEILIFVDTTLFEYFKNDIVETVAYTLTLMNGADLNFRDIKNPKINLNIAGIVLCQDQVIRNNPFLVTDVSLSDFSNFMFKEKNFKVKKNYDVAILLGLNKNPSDDTVGLSYDEGVCSKNSAAEVIYSTGLVMDDSELSGIETTTHELAHIFGAPHDNEKTGPCSQKEGHIMSYNLHDKKQFHFSPCSKENMTTFLRSKTAKCLRNNPGINITDNEILRIMPGKYMTIDEQCQKLGYKKANEVNPAICSNIKCLKNNNESINLNPSIAALEGTVCDPQLGKFCWRGECVEPKFVETDGTSDTKIKFSPSN